MSIPIAENPAVTDPIKYLTKPERDALISIDFYRRQRAVGPDYQIGPKRVRKQVVFSIQQKGLIKPSRTGYVPTMGGELALARLKGEAK